MRGAVAAGHRLTAEAAVDVLREGGNAFDAAIAALWTACLVEPVLASPGGGGFLMAHPADGRPRLFDFFVHTPRRKPPLSEIEFEAVEVDFGPATQEFHVGSGASAVPGMVPGLYAVHEQLGQLPMTRLCEPAVAIGRAGWTLTDFQADLLSIVAPIYRWTPAAADLFAPSGTLIGVGDRFANPDLAHVIDTIAREGPRIASEGEIAAAMVEGGGDTALRTKDLAGYRVEVREPLRTGTESWQVLLNPPPSCGGMLIGHMLAQMVAPGHGRRTGPARTPLELAQIIDATDRLWRKAGRSIETFASRPGGRVAGDPASVRAKGTTHVSVIDAQGNTAAATVSNGEGNGRIVPGCGFMLNNMLGEEDLNPGEFYRWPENTRLSSMMAPSILRTAQGSLTALGSGGSNRIRTALFQVLYRLIIDPKLSLEAAVEQPRLHVEAGHLDFEDLLREDQRTALAAAFEDHLAWPDRSMFYGGVHAVRRSPRGELSGAGDPRRAGVYLTA